MVVLITSAVLAAIISIGIYVGLGFIFSLWTNPIFYAFIPLVVLGFVFLFLYFLSLFALFIFVSSRFLSRKKPVTKVNGFAQWMLGALSDIITVFFGIKLIMSKEDKEFFKEFKKQKKTAVFIMNHTSNLDMFVIWSLFKGIPMMALSKPEIEALPVVGRFSYRAGNISINRDNPMQALRGISNSVKIIKENPNGSFFIFPEGTRSKDGTLQEFHATTFIIPEKTQKDIIILAAQNLEKVKQRGIKGTKIPFKVVKALTHEELTGMSSQQMSDTSHQIIKKYLDENPQQIYK